VRSSKRDTVERGAAQAGTEGGQGGRSAEMRVERCRAAVGFGRDQRPGAEEQPCLHRESKHRTEKVSQMRNKRQNASCINDAFILNELLRFLLPSSSSNCRRPTLLSD
jgi:hypothetical protein